MTPEQTPYKVNIVNSYLNAGSFEGHDYYQLIAETDTGIKLKTKLTAFEYNVMKANA